MIDTIRELYPKIPTKQLAAQLGVSLPTLHNYASILGVQRDADWIKFLYTCRHDTPRREEPKVKPIRAEYDPNRETCWGGYCHASAATHRKYMACIIPTNK